MIRCRRCGDFVGGSYVWKWGVRVDVRADRTYHVCRVDKVSATYTCPQANDDDDSIVTQCTLTKSEVGSVCTLTIAGT